MGGDPVFLHSYFRAAIVKGCIVILLIATDRDVYERSHDTDDHRRAGSA
jgi:hypothetical protein